MNTPSDQDLSRQYDESVELERAAWHELHAHAPGSVERALAWNAWSEAIVRTNRAWRRLSASRLCCPGGHPVSPDSARAHANA